MAQVRIYSTPSRLFRYRPLTASTVSREIEAITEGYIYCPKFSAMNDPMEGMHRSSVAYALRVPKERKQQVIAERNKLGIASLSEVHDHEPMWAHYADQFQGMCVQYATRKLLRHLPDDVDLVRMAYSETPPVLLSSRDSVIDKAKLTLATKTVRWASEREWRLINPSVGRTSYDAKSCVTKIYLGARVSRPAERSVREAMERLDIPVVKMKIDRYLMAFSPDGE